MKTEDYKSIYKQYTQWLITLGFSHSMVYNYKYSLRDFFNYLEEQNILQISLITDKTIKIYFEYLQTRPNKRRNGVLSVPSLNHHFDAIDKFCEFLHQMGNDAAPSPTSFRLSINENDRVFKVEPFTIEEIKILQENIPNVYPNLSFTLRERYQEELKLIFALYYGCGLRRTEGFNLTFQDIDFDKKTIFVQQGKGYKDRIVPMSAGVYKIIENYIYNFRNCLKLKHSRLFVHSVDVVAKSLKELQNVCNCESIQNKRLTPHILRHSIATHLLQNKMPIESISRFLGHAGLDATQIYTHMSEE